MRDKGEGRLQMAETTVRRDAINSGWCTLYQRGASCAFNFRFQRKRVQFVPQLFGPRSWRNEMETQLQSSVPYYSYLSRQNIGDVCLTQPFARIYVRVFLFCVVLYRRFRIAPIFVERNVNSMQHILVGCFTLRFVIVIQNRSTADYGCRKN